MTGELYFEFHLEGDMNMAPLKDETTVALVENAREGREAFEQLVRRYQHDVFWVVRIYTNIESDAEDLAQETWLKVYRSLGQLKDSRLFESWLKSIAANTAKNWLASRARKESQVTDEMEPQQLFGAAILRYQQQQQFKQIRDAINSLSAKNREVVYDFYICGYSAAEVSQRLKIPISTVNSRLKEARNKLREEFASMVAESGIQEKFAPDNFVQNVMERVGRLPMPVPKGNIIERIRRMLRQNFIPAIGIATLIAFAIVGVIYVNLGNIQGQASIPARFAGARQASNEGRIAFCSKRDGNWEIYVMDADGNNPVNLTQHGADDYNPVWSPDGKKIAFNSQRDGNGEIYVMDADGSNVKRLTNHPEEDWFTAWSPDGKKIAFPSSRDVKFEDIWVMDADGANVKRITFNNRVIQGLSWSSAQKIAYVFALNKMDCPIFVMDPDGKNQTRISKRQEWTAYPAWSPDGKKIAYAFNEGGNFDKVGNWEIVVMDADGENRVNLTQHEAWDTFPTWSPDGKKIAFASTRDGQRWLDIYIMDADGSNVKRLTDNPAPDQWLSWVGSSYAVEPTGKLKTIWGKIRRKLFGK